MAHSLFTRQLGRNLREHVEAAWGPGSEQATLTSVALYESKKVIQQSHIQRKDS